MSFTRRDFLKTAGAAVAIWTLPPAHAAAAGSPKQFTLRPGVFDQQVRGGAKTRVWGFNGSVPGPVLRYAQGDRVRIVCDNQLPAETTVHWHGLRVPNPMDGVPQVTQRPIPVGGRFEYEFELADAGSFWYHPHQMSFEQVARGLFGMFIIDEAAPIRVDREAVWVFSDFKLASDNQQVEDFGSMSDVGGSGRLGNTFLLNGRAIDGATRFDVRSGERVRLRLCNAATARIFLLEFPGHEPRVVAYDGQGVEPHPLPHGQLLLGPGQRVDLVVDFMQAPGKSFRVVDRRDQGTDLVRVAYSTKRPLRAKPLNDPIRIAPNPLREPDLSKAIEHYIVFEGGFLGKPAIGLVDGKPLNVAEIMMREKLAWTVNYTAEHEHAMMHVPFLHLGLNEHAVIKLVNETEFEHPMHLHGHAFRVLAVNDRPIPHRPWRDTVMLGPRGSADIALVADNPGEWMFHCHILEHAAGGMMGTIEVG